MTADRAPAAPRAPRTPATPAARRRRGAVLEAAILDAAAAVVREAGYAGLSMDRVAQRAGTNKNAIYRRWPNRAALGIAAYRWMVETEGELPETGELRGDALALLRWANRHWSSPAGEILRALAASAGDHPDLMANIREQLGDAGQEVWLQILARAVARGEARAEALHPRIATVAVGLLRDEFAARGVTMVPDAVIVEIIDLVYLPLVRQPASE